MLPQAEFVAILCQGTGPLTLAPAQPRAHVVTAHCNLCMAAHPTVYLSHTYGHCERVSCVYLEKGLFPVARAGGHQVRCRASRAPPHSPIGMFCISCLSLFSQGFLVFLLQAYSTWHCFISCVFSPIAI